MNSPDDLTILRVQREARFAELDAMSKQQLYEVLKRQEKNGASLPRLSVLARMTKAALVWALIDSEMPNDD